MTVTAIRFPMLRSALRMAMLAICLAALQCTAESSVRNTNGNSVISKVSGNPAGRLPSGNSGTSNVIGAVKFNLCTKTGKCRTTVRTSAVNSHPGGNPSKPQTSQSANANPQTPAQTTPVTTITTKNGGLNHVDVSDAATRGTSHSSDSPPTDLRAGGLVTDPSRSVLVAPRAPPPSRLPNSADKDTADHLNDANGHNTATGSNEKSTNGKQSSDGDKDSNGDISGDLLSPHTDDRPGVIPATTTITTKPIIHNANKEAITREEAGGSSGSQSLSPTRQNPTSHGTPAAKPTRAHTTEPAKPGKKQSSVKVTTKTTSTNSAAHSAQEPAAAKPEEKDTTQLQALKSTTSTAAPTDSKQTSELSTTEFAKGESTASPTSFPKLPKALQSLDMKDSSVGSSAFFALAALATFVVMAMAPA